MAQVELTFTGIINISAQIEDIIWTAQLKQNQVGTNHPLSSSSKKIIKLGTIVSVDQVTNTITYDEITSLTQTQLEQADRYFFFAKNMAANTSGLLGYYASVEYRNYSKRKAEIFATGTNYAPSSK